MFLLEFNIYSIPTFQTQQIITLGAYIRIKCKRVKRDDFGVCIDSCLCQRFPDCNNGCDDSSGVFPILLPVASSESWTDSYKESFFFGDNLMRKWSTVNNWSSYSIKWKVNFFYISCQKLHSLLCFLLLWKNTKTKRQLVGHWRVYFFVCFLIIVCYSGKQEQEPRQRHGSKWLICFLLTVCLPFLLIPPKTSCAELV